MISLLAPIVLIFNFVLLFLSLALLPAGGAFIRLHCSFSVFARISIVSCVCYAIPCYVWHCTHFIRPIYHNAHTPKSQTIQYTTNTHSSTYFHTRYCVAHSMRMHDQRENNAAWFEQLPTMQTILSKTRSRAKKTWKERITNTCMMKEGMSEHREMTTWERESENRTIIIINKRPIFHFRLNVPTSRKQSAKIYQYSLWKKAKKNVSFDLWASHSFGLCVAVVKLPYFACPESRAYRIYIYFFSPSIT